MMGCRFKNKPSITFKVTELIYQPLTNLLRKVSCRTRATIPLFLKYYSKDTHTILDSIAISLSRQLAFA